MPLFLIQQDEELDYVEAPSMIDAIQLWKLQYLSDEDPDQVHLVHQDAVLRTTAQEAHP